MAEASFTVRRGTAADSRECFSVFRAGLGGLLHRQGYLAEARDDSEGKWPQYEAIFDHLARTGAEWWVAEADDGVGDGDGRLLGYARSIERGGLVELTEFFVRPDVRVGGMGRALLERAFPPGWGERRSIIATQDPAAVALYLRFGVQPQATACGFAGRPGPAEPGAGLSVDTASVDAVLALEEEILGRPRPEEVEFICGSRPGVVASRAGRPIGYAFLPDERGWAGPVAARDPADLPALLALVERAAHEAGQEALEIDVPLTAGPAVRWLLDERRFKIDPFFILLMADGPWARFDRYLPYTPCLFL